MRLPPCKKKGTDCTKRAPGCQDRCEDFQIWKAERDSKREKAQTAHDVWMASYDGSKRLARIKSQAARSMQKRRRDT